MISQMNQYSPSIYQQHWNEEHETSYNTTLSDTSNANVLKDDAYRIDGLYEDDAQRKAIEFPSHIDNFNQCELRSVMW